MKKVYLILGIAFFLHGCKTVSVPKNALLKDEAPFIITNAFYEQLGKQEYIISLKVAGSTIHPKTIYFDGLQGKVVSKDSMNFTAYLIPGKPLDNAVLHDDPKREYGNTLPSTHLKKQNFRLLKNQGLIGYEYQESEYLFKIKLVQKK